MRGDTDKWPFSNIHRCDNAEKCGREMERGRRNTRREHRMGRTKSDVARVTIGRRLAQWQWLRGGPVCVCRLAWSLAGYGSIVRLYRVIDSAAQQPQPYPVLVTCGVRRLLLRGRKYTQHTCILYARLDWTGNPNIDGGDVAESRHRRRFDCLLTITSRVCACFVYSISRWVVHAT